MTETVRTAGFHIPLLGSSRPMKHESLRGRLSRSSWNFVTTVQ